MLPLCVDSTKIVLNLRYAVGFVFTNQDFAELRWMPANRLMWGKNRQKDYELGVTCRPT